jgi:signal peptidase I
VKAGQARPAFTDHSVLKTAVLFALSGLGLALALFRGNLVRRYVVEGDSMLRAYRPGDHLIAEGLSYRLRPPRPGEVVVVRQPGGGGRLDLKRLFAGPGANVAVGDLPRVLAEDEWFVIGDNLDASTDSRERGPVRRQDIVGRVWFRY